MTRKESQNNWKKRILLFFISQSITLFGSQLVQMAVLWYITLQTDCGGWIAAFSVFSYLPQFFISFIGGALADRKSKKHLILLSDGLIAAVTLVMVLLMPRLSSEPFFPAALLLMSFLCGKREAAQDSHTKDGSENISHERCLKRMRG